MFRPDAGPHSPALHHASPLSPTEDTGAAHLGPRLAPREQPRHHVVTSGLSSNAALQALTRSLRAELWSRSHLLLHLLLLPFVVHGEERHPCTSLPG